MVGSIGGGGVGGVEGDMGVEVVNTVNPDGSITVSAAPPRPDMPSNFGSYGYGGGGYNVTNFGTDFAQNAIQSGHNPGNFGLPGIASDYQTGGKYDPQNFSVGGGFSQESTQGFDSTTGMQDIEVVGKALDPMAVYENNLANSAFNSSSFTDPSGAGFNPVTPDFSMPQTGPMGGRAGPMIKKFITKLAEIHPATATPMLLMQIGKGLFNSKNVAGDMKKVITQFGMNKLMGNVGISSLGKQALGSLQNVNKGRQTGGQAIGSLMTNAAFRKGFPSLAKQAYQKGGEPAVYGLLSLASMGMENLNKNYFRTPPSGPPGDG